MPLSTDTQPVSTGCACGEPVKRAMTFRERLAFFRQAVRRIIGAPDYEAYLARHQQIHPEAPPMSEKEFFRFAMDRRYSKASPRCC